MDLQFLEIHEGCGLKHASTPGRFIPACGWPLR